jgi:ankyrin repeat protein
MNALPAVRMHDGNLDKALLIAAEAGRAEVVGSLLLRGADPDAPDEIARSPAMLAARNGHIGALRALLRGGADIDLRRGGTDAWPALMYAIHGGQRAAALALLGWGADPNASGRSGYNALMMAAGIGDVDLVEALLSRGADPDRQQALGFNALDYAVAYGHTEIVRTLLRGPHGGPDLPHATSTAVRDLAEHLGYTEILSLVGSASSAGS